MLTPKGRLAHDMILYHEGGEGTEYDLLSLHASSVIREQGNFVRFDR